MQFKYDEAIPLYEKLIAQGFDNFESNFILGLCYEDLPDNEKALKHYQKAVSVQNDNATCLFHLALIEKSFCMDSLSMAHFNQSLEVSLPKDRALRTYKWLADLHFQHSRYADAARDFELSILTMKKTRSTITTPLKCSSLPKQAESETVSPVILSKCKQTGR